MQTQNERPAPETASARADRQLATLAELAELTLRVLRKTADDAIAEPPPLPDSAGAKPRRAAPSQVFDRLAKSLRETIALENRIAGVPAPLPDKLAAPDKRSPGRAVPSYLRKPPADPAARDDLSLISQRFSGGSGQ
jgi:hypothetical protein